MPEGVQRRLAAIVAADIVGYARLMGADEAGTLAALRAHRAGILDPLIGRHGGRIVKTTGDGMLLEFASAVAAAEFAIAMQAGMAERNRAVPGDRAMRFRIGIHVGEVIIEDGDIFGDGVNVAARIEPLAAPGGISLSDDAHRQVAGRLEAEWDDGGERALKNIARPLRVWHWRQGGQGATAPAPAPEVILRQPRILLSPFRHAGPGGDAAALASGLTETLAAAMAHFEEFELIDPGSAERAIAEAGALEAGRRLGARYVLEGSVQIALRKARIGVQMIDCVTGQRVWSDTLDRALDDVFALQDDVTATVASTLSDAVGEERARAIAGKPTAELDLDELMMRGLQHLHRATGREENQTAREIFERVRRAAPEALFPTLCLCWTYAIEFRGGWGPSQPDTLDHCLGLTEDLIHRYPRSAHAHRLMSRLVFFKGEYEQGLAHARRAYELNPYHSDMMIELGIALMRNGRSDEAIAEFRRAFATNPYAPEGFRVNLALAQFLTGRFEAGLETLGSMARGAGPASVYRILNLVGQERIAEAEREVQALRAADPAFTIHAMHPVLALKEAADRDRVTAALRRVGLLE